MAKLIATGDAATIKRLHQTIRGFKVNIETEYSLEEQAPPTREPADQEDGEEVKAEIPAAAEKQGKTKKK